MHQGSSYSLFFINSRKELFFARLRVSSTVRINQIHYKKSWACHYFRSFFIRRDESLPISARCDSLQRVDVARRKSLQRSFFGWSRQNVNTMNNDKRLFKDCFIALVSIFKLETTMILPTSKIYNKSYCLISFTIQIKNSRIASLQQVSVFLALNQ